jgi:hypothetical protein
LNLYDQEDQQLKIVAFEELLKNFAL